MEKYLLKLLLSNIKYDVYIHFLLNANLPQGLLKYFHQPAWLSQG